MEKGVGLWLRDGAGADWRHAVVVRIAASSSDAAAPREVVVRRSDGRKDQTLLVDVAAIENEQEPDIMLANSHDMVRMD